MEISMCFYLLNVLFMQVKNKGVGQLFTKCEKCILFNTFLQQKCKGK